MTVLSRHIRASDYPRGTRLGDVHRALIAQGYRLRQTRQGLIAIRRTPR